MRYFWDGVMDLYEVGFFSYNIKKQEIQMFDIHERSIVTLSTPDLSKLNPDEINEYLLKTYQEYYRMEEPKDVKIM